MIPDEYLQQPRPDDQLAADMRDATRRLQSQDDRLDLSVSSLNVIEGLAGAADDNSQDAHLGAYLGEVLLGQIPGAVWTRGPSGPAVAIRKYLSDPFLAVAELRVGTPGSLLDYARDLTDFAAHPTTGTARGLGWRGADTAWDQWRLRRGRRHLDVGYPARRAFAGRPRLHAARA